MEHELHTFGLPAVGGLSRGVYDEGSAVSGRRLLKLANILPWTGYIFEKAGLTYIIIMS
jgi:hypothetical protein